ncbi:probable cytochrome P450 6a21 [Musca vetustissima]|uniref:probable cytochrome P450 6a21 n=1 Tax=Musca vetustissima TaxID=27455 RepID=UPI002AB5FE30|nr:probable cytochrome P450 6a21 [Musca vetustissima]
MWEIFLLTLILLLALVINRVKNHYKYWQKLEIPCGETHWIFGSMVGVVSKRTFFDLWLEYYNRFKGSGPFAGFFWFFKRAVFIMDPGLIKQILIKDFDKFMDRGLFYNEIDDPLSAHLFSMHGQKWRNLRNKLSPTFTSGKMKTMFPTVVQVGRELVDVLRSDIPKDPEIEIRSLMARYTTDVIGYCAFGIECCSLKDPEQLFYIMSKRALLENNLGSLGVAFRGSFPKLARRLHMKDTVADVENFFLGTVRETVRYREENSVQRTDFMNLLLELKNNRVLKNERGDDFVNLTFNEIAAHAFLFLVAGSETSSNTMVFALYELAKNVEVQERARDEVRKVFEACNQEMGYETMREMKYLKQVIDETLRLHTPLPVLNRQALEDYPIPGHPKYIIRKDMPVIIPAICIHRDEQYYPNPDNFNPDNFTPEQIALRDPVLYLPFGDGPRNCIGLRFAKMQMMVGLSLLLSKFKFELCSRTPVPMKYDKENFMLTPDGDLFLKVSEI